MANGWFVEVVSPDTALLSIDGPGGVPEQSAASAAAAQPVAQRELRWGEDRVKTVAIIPVGELAPLVGELPADLSSALRAAKSAPSALRKLPARPYAPHPEIPDRLLSKKRTEKLYRSFLARSPTKEWCALNGDQKRFQVVVNRCNWPELLNRFLASCIHHGLPVHSYMLDEWERLIKPPKPVALRGWRPRRHLVRLSLRSRRLLRCLRWRLPRRQSRIPGIPVQSLNFPESAPIPAGIPGP
jgi:hypothetical protein